MNSGGWAARLSPTWSVLFDQYVSLSQLSPVDFVTPIHRSRSRLSSSMFLLEFTLSVALHSDPHPSRATLIYPSIVLLSIECPGPNGVLILMQLAHLMDTGMSTLASTHELSSLIGIFMLRRCLHFDDHYRPLNF
ncbi:hypothetical protein Hypma_016593 [Hypsizygus marmoreus]|uniref:Uncharacterized protein n=1 Tax=Hypsizygus marmoreus TaxID=39966 RepID=A0A369IYD7_HYPMA|nr:hypothetical protein Hypma_016593 [Hypsizygus marmoreus]